MLKWRNSNFSKRRLLTMSAIRTYHLVIKMIRLFLLLALGGVTAGLIFIPLLLKPSQSRTHSPTYRLSALKNKLYQAKYCASHQDNPYCITAHRAHNISEEKVALSTLQSTLHQDLRDLSLISDTGLYDRTKEVLHLDQNVQLITSDGYIFKAPTATIQLKENQIRGTQGVTGHGPLGSLQATQFELHNQGEKIILKGPSKLVIERE